MNKLESQKTNSGDWRPWPWRLAVLLVAVVFPLIWFGGLVTSNDAGMAVPDWPTTYGYNMFLYPFSSWFFGPWDFFLEHGHRLLGSTAGLLAIGLVIACLIWDRRRWVWIAAGGLLLMIVAQGILGGSRVINDARVLAKIHGCFAPAIFGATAAFCVVLSRWWNQTNSKPSVSRSEAKVLLRAWVWLAIAFLQLVVGAFIRHIDVEASPRGFQHLVYTHLTLAVLILGGTHMHGAAARRLPGADRRIKAAARWLSILVTIQFLLGLTTWITKYGWPSWFDWWLPAAQFVIPEKTFWQMNIVTLHVALGSLIVAIWAVQVTRCFHVFGVGERDKLPRSESIGRAANV